MFHAMLHGAYMCLCFFMYLSFNALQVCLYSTKFFATKKVEGWGGLLPDDTLKKRKGGGKGGGGGGDDTSSTRPPPKLKPLHLVAILQS